MQKSCPNHASANIIRKTVGVPSASGDLEQDPKYLSCMTYFESSRIEVRTGV